MVMHQGEPKENDLMFIGELVRTEGKDFEAGDIQNISKSLTTGSLKNIFKNQVGAPTLLKNHS